MDVWNYINIIGTTLTCMGTGLAFWQASKAKKYKEEIQIDRLKMVLIDLLPDAKMAREECKKICTPVERPMRGVDQQNVIDKIQDFIDKVREHSHQFTIPELHTAINSLDMYIADYKQCTEGKERYGIGDCIFTKLNDVISMIAGIKDKTI